MDSPRCTVRLGSDAQWAATAAAVARQERGRDTPLQGSVLADATLRIAFPLGTGKAVAGRRARRDLLLFRNGKRNIATEAAAVNRKCIYEGRRLARERTVSNVIIGVLSRLCAASQIRTCPFRASGSSSYGFTACGDACACGHGSTKTRSKPQYRSHVNCPRRFRRDSHFRHRHTTS